MTLTAWPLAVGQETELSPKNFVDDLGAKLGAVVNCVVCGYDYTRVIGAHTSFGTDEHEAGKAYEGTIARGVRHGWRRDALVIDVSGECGHRFELIIQQHKGQSFLRTRRLPNVEPADADA